MFNSYCIWQLAWDSNLLSTSERLHSIYVLISGVTTTLFAIGWVCERKIKNEASDTCSNYLQLSIFGIYTAPRLLSRGTPDPWSSKGESPDPAGENAGQREVFSEQRDPHSTIEKALFCLVAVRACCTPKSPLEAGVRRDWPSEQTRVGMLIPVLVANQFRLLKTGFKPVFGFTGLCRNLNFKPS